MAAKHLKQSLLDAVHDLLDAYVDAASRDERHELLDLLEIQVLGVLEREDKLPDALRVLDRFAKAIEAEVQVDWDKKKRDDRRAA